MNLTLPQNEYWSSAQKLGFRFIFILFLLFILPFPISNLFNVFNSTVIDDAVGDFWNWISEGVALNIMGMEEVPQGNQGSGDKTVDWIRHGVFLVVSFLGAAIWSFLDNGRKNYYKLWRVLVVITVYYLIYFMFLYGFIKVFWLQMTELRIDRLLKTYGQSSPMGLLWSFMGATKSYSMYAGFSEVIAGVLLIFRRTRTLGGLVTFGVMFNVFMLNMTFDIPVKLFSAQLMLMGLYIAMIDRKAIMALLIFQKPATAAPWPPFFKSQINNWILLGIQILFLGYITYDQISGNLENRKRFGELRPKSALYGLYDVEHYIQNGDTIPPLMTDDTRWQRVIFDSPTFSAIMLMDDRMSYYSTKVDTVNETITFSVGRDSLRKDYPMTYEKLEDGLQLNGVLRSDTLNLKLKTYDLSKFYLTNRGFHWVNEVPWHRYDPVPKPNW